MKRVRNTEAVAEQLMLTYGGNAAHAAAAAETGNYELPESGYDEHPTDRYYPEAAIRFQASDPDMPEWIRDIAETGGPEPEPIAPEVILDVDISSGMALSKFALDGTAEALLGRSTTVQSSGYSFERPIY